MLSVLAFHALISSLPSVLSCVPLFFSPPGRSTVSLNRNNTTKQKYLRTRGPCPPYPGLDVADDDGDDGAGGSGVGRLSDDAVQVRRLNIQLDVDVVDGGGNSFRRGW